MRNRREEFVRRFEELTKQEIKNYNDSLLETHRSLNKFREDLQGVVEGFSQSIARLTSAIKNLELENQDIKAKLETCRREQKDILFEFRTFERTLLTERADSNKNQKSANAKIKEIEHYLVLFSKDVKEETKLLASHIDSLSHQIRTAKEFSKQNAEKIKREILELPSEAERVKKEIVSLVDSQKVDNKGLIKELEKIKKQSFRQEKMFEYFHNQLDRIKSKLEDK